MPTPPPRKFFPFQIHLSTAIVMMFVAGGLIWANTNVDVRYYWNGSSPVELTYAKRGWPVGGLYDYSEIPFDERQRFKYPSFAPIYPLLALDFVVATIILCATWFLCEWLIRRRAARKGN